MTRVLLLNGPLNGYVHEAEFVGEGSVLRFNALDERGYRQHDYHLQSSDIERFETVYVYRGDHVSSLRLEHLGIDVPPDAFAS